MVSMTPGRPNTPVLRRIVAESAVTLTGLIFVVLPVLLTTAGYAAASTSALPDSWYDAGGFHTRIGQSWSVVRAALLLQVGGAAVISTFTVIAAALKLAVAQAEAWCVAAAISAAVAGALLINPLV